MIVQGNAVLATLNAANPIYADFSISESEYLALQRQGGLGSSPFTLTLADGERFPGTGEFVLTENQVDAQTGTLMLRARFDNPSLLLKPGGFGRVTMKSHDLDQALVIPQKAVFSNQSLTSVYIVKDDNTVEPRNVQLGESLGEQVVVAGGLEPGETIVVDGLQKVRPGAPITPQQAGAPDGSAQPGAASGAKAG